MGVEIIFAALHALVGSETMAKILERTARTAAWFCTSAHGPHQLQVVEERITTYTPLKPKHKAEPRKKRRARCKVNF
jgi:hypothetical protein